MDRSLHPARPQNQTLVLSNHLVITTVEFLNEFAEECDAKLCKLHQKMQRLEIEVKLLEIKLRSIPGAQPPGTWILASNVVAALAHVQLARRPCTRVLALSHRPRRRAADQRGGGRYGRAARGRYGRAARGREWGTASAATDCGRSPAAAAADQHDCAAAAATAAATTAARWRRRSPAASTASATTSATAATIAGATTALLTLTLTLTLNRQP